MKRAFYLLVAGGGLIAMAAPASAQYFRVPNGQLPPPGLCRVWYPGVAPGRQPGPTSCRAAERQAARSGARVVYGGSGGPGYGNRYDTGPRFIRWAHRNFDFNRDGVLSRRELRMARDAWYRR